MDPARTSSEIKLLAIIIIALAFIFLTSFIFSSRVERKDNSVPSGVVSTPFLNITLKAKAVYVYDIRNKTVLYVKKEDIRLPLASLSKVMAALVAEDLNPLYSVIRIPGQALELDGENGLLEGEAWSLKNLLDYSLVASSNDGMRAVALSLGALSKAGVTEEEIINDFVREMNRKADDLDLKNTYFWNETGLDESNIKGGAYGTAKDMSKLFEYVLEHNPEIFAATREILVAIPSLDNRIHLARNTNSVINEIPGVLASKTGLTNTAGGNLIFAFDPELGRPIVVSILGSTESGRFTDARILVNAIMEYIRISTNGSE